MQIDLDIGKIGFNCGIYIFMALFIGVSQAAGIGGGPILNICLMLGLGYGAKQSMAITYIFLIGGSIASIYSNYGKKLHGSNKNAMDEELVTITLPMTVAGSIFGTIFNHFVSEFIITLAFTVLLSYLAMTSYAKYIASKTKKTSQSLQIQLHQHFQQKLVDERKQQKLQKIIEFESTPLRNQNLKIYFLVIVFSIIVLLLKGGSTSDSIIGLTKCGFGTWIIIFLHLIISFCYGRKIAYKLSLRDMKKQYFGYIFKDYEFKISSQFNKTMLLGFAGGFIGGILGIGGAIILIPVWLDMGVDKDVASSSSAPLILASAIISTFIAALCGLYDSFLMLVFNFMWSFMAAFYIKSGIVYIKNKYQMQGIIYLLLVIVMVMSLVFLLPYSIGKMFDDPEDFFEFGHLC